MELANIAGDIATPGDGTLASVGVDNLLYTIAVWCLVGFGTSSVVAWLVARISASVVGMVVVAVAVAVVVVVHGHA
jgi:hypothetical protein